MPQVRLENMSVMTSAVTASRLSVRRGGRVVLSGLSFDVRPGSVYGLLGPSGCGKTTLMRAVVGVQQYEGRLDVLGFPAGSPALRGRIGYVSQSPSVYGDITVAENLRYFTAVAGAGSGRAAQVLAVVGLSAKARTRVAELSGGERARVSLAVALLGEPELLILDEPTVGLDPLLRRELWEVFAGLAAAGTTLLVSSHVMDEAERCDVLMLLREGEILVAGDSPAELLVRTGALSVEDAFVALVSGPAT
jgi:ABC-2 type transport system ATP-binding protein